MSVELENELRSRRPRAVPAAWRSEILHACREFDRPAPAIFAPVAAAPSQLQPVREIPRRRTLFWPHPRAWAALAAIWIVLLLTNRQVTAPLPGSATSPLPPGYWAQQREHLRTVQLEIALLEESSAKRLHTIEPFDQPTLENRPTPSEVLP